MGNSRLAQWRAGRTEEVTLPSGLVVTAKRISLEDVIMSGDIPKPLMGMLSALQTEATANALTVDRLVEFMPVVDRTVRLAILEPPIADVADDDHLSIEELPAKDRLALFSWLVQPAAALAPFRSEPVGAVDAAPGGDGVQQPAERDPGHRGRLAGVPARSRDADAGSPD
jgi:hypothetical protein